MRMKKIMIFAVTVLTLAACSKTFDHSKAATEGNAIGFGTWAETLTKARATGKTTTSFTSGEIFKVYGTKLVGSTKYPVFNGTEIKATADGTTVNWDYNNAGDIRYWDRAATSYTFYAALPGSMVTAYSSLTDDQKTAISSTEYHSNGLFYGSFTFEDPTSMSNDVLVADENTVVVNDTNVKNDVELEFNHIASCVDLKAKKDVTLKDATVKVTGVKFVNICKTGNFHVSSYSPFTVAWSDQTGTLGTSGTYTADLGGDKVVEAYSSYGTTEPADPNAVNTTTGTPVDVLGGFVFLPQTLAANTQKILLTYSIAVGSEQPSVYTDVPVDIVAFMTDDHNDNAGGAAIDVWEAGKRYIYTITIGANAITFTASVKDWATTVNGYYHLVN